MPLIYFINTSNSTKQVDDDNDDKQSSTGVITTQVAVYTPLMLFPVLLYMVNEIAILS